MTTEAIESVKPGETAAESPQNNLPATPPVNNTLEPAESESPAPAPVKPTGSAASLQENLKQIRTAIDTLQPVEESLGYLKMLCWPGRLKAFQGLINATQVEESLTLDQRKHLSDTLQENATRDLGIDPETMAREKGPFHFVPLDKYQPYKQRLHELEQQLHANPPKLDKLEIEINLLRDQIEVEIIRMKNRLVRYLYTGVLLKKDEEYILSQIGNPEWKDDIANDFRIIRSRSQIVSDFTGQMPEDGTDRGTNNSRNPPASDGSNNSKASSSRASDKMKQIQNLSVDYIEPLKMEVPRIINALIEIEQRRLNIHSLVRRDHEIQRKIRTVGYGVISGLIVILLMFFGIGWWFSGMEIFELGKPPTPIQMVVWSLIGSLAALIQRLHRNRIGCWSEFFRWVLARPAQSVVLSAAFYLIISAGSLLNLPLFNSALTSESNRIAVTAVVLLMAFLIGFSDSFTGWIFNTLVGTYTKKNDTSATTSK